MNQPVDHEIKFALPNSKSFQVIEWLKLNCKPDPKYPSGTVSSIYYDTRNWRFLFEKLNGFYLKTKIRLRWYSDLNYKNHTDYSFVEAKFKTGARRDKVRIRTGCTGTWLSGLELQDFGLIPIPLLLLKEGVPLRSNVFPVFQISYKRYRFIEPATDSRICFDHNISSPAVNNLMVPKMNPFKLKTAVLEVKGRISELPGTLYGLSDIGIRKSSFSKYSECYKKLIGAQF